MPPTSLAEELQARLPDSAVVKAFNTAFASRQAEPYLAGVAADGFVAGDDAAAKQTVLDIVESIGFRPVDAGSLAVGPDPRGNGLAEHQPGSRRGHMAGRLGHRRARGCRRRIAKLTTERD